jgi:LSD1 subclass zinc finger protein
MKSINFNCIKCGNPMQAPEKSERVLCAVCGTTNSPGGTFAKLKALTEKSTIPANTDYKYESYQSGREMNDDNPFYEAPEGHTFPDEEQKVPNKRGLGLTAIFVLMPVVIMISELLKIPPIIILAAAAVIFVLFIKNKIKK